MKEAVIIGAGPAGLTAALELSARAGVRPVVLEKSHEMGGLSRTACYKGNRIDIGGHRFFSKSDRVMQWWLGILPLEASANTEERFTYRNKARTFAAGADGPDPNNTDSVMLIRSRLSRIYFMRQFFDYPITLSADTLRKLGMVKVARIGASYAWSAAFRRPERTLEDFFINRFGRELYLTFFKSYTEKVWGVPCDKISAEWGAQRVKGLSIYKTLLHALKRLRRAPSSGGISQKSTETSLIEKFMYPKYGPGQMWQEVAKRVIENGGEILTGWAVESIESSGREVAAVWARNTGTGERRRFAGDYYFSTMPVKELVNAMTPPPPADVRAIAEGLIYRDFITVGILCNRLKIADADGSAVKDNWIYIQEPDVLVGRLQVFNNWSPYLVADQTKTWVGLEYFCYESDEIWSLPDAAMIDLAKRELAQLGILDPKDFLDATVIRVPKTYPAYFGTYDKFPRIIEWADAFENLFLIGRNGMHKYNNQDHSMLAAMTAVDNIIAGVGSRDGLWSLNTEMEYHEEKNAAAAKSA